MSNSLPDPMERAEIFKSMAADLPVPFKSAYVSTLGGKHRPSVMLTVSLDPKSSWTNGILENSRYAKLSVNFKGDFDVDAEHFSGYGMTKMRKFKASSPEEAFRKISAWLAKQ